MHDKECMPTTYLSAIDCQRATVQDQNLNSAWHWLGSSYGFQAKPKAEPRYLFLISGSRLQVAGFGLEPTRLRLYA